MHIYRKIYEFAASAGAYEGYVYNRAELDMEALSNWTENLAAAYDHLPEDVLAAIQEGCNATVGRAIRSLMPLLGEDHAIVAKLKTMVTEPAPQSADDFDKTKWFQNAPQP